MIKLSDFELGWLVGILEGEGYFAYVPRTQRLAIEMVDEDTMNSVALMFSKIVGKEVNPVHRLAARDNHQDAFQIQLSGESARLIMKAVLPYMHHRRRARIWQALNNYAAPKQKTLKELGIDIRSLVGETK